MRALRVDTTLAGFDGLRIRRADHLFLFFGEEADTGGRHLPPGSLLVLHRGKSASGSGSHGPTANAGRKPRSSTPETTTTTATRSSSPWRSVAMTKTTTSWSPTSPYPRRAVAATCLAGAAWRRRCTHGDAAVLDDVPGELSLGSCRRCRPRCCSWRECSGAAAGVAVAVLLQSEGERMGD
uniref:Uncharacterized protein K0081B11.6 n=1 Tax=Oryza sativa subsp. indica TaxID=39946 RepID=C8TF47_ORYSI|nr:hypothetical protein [Oryza sativa Indica Group]BAI39982.1 hypothetical protein [Oryza sativa Indica Group]